jgi:hypothetical protein
MFVDMTILIDDDPVPVEVEAYWNPPDEMFREGPSWDVELVRDDQGAPLALDDADVDQIVAKLNRMDPDEDDEEQTDDFWEDE